MCFAVFLWIFCRGLGLECTVHFVSLQFPLEIRKPGEERIAGFGMEPCLLDAFLSPFKVPLDLFGRFRTICEVGTGAFKTALGECLQFRELTLFGIEFARSADDQYLMAKFSREYFRSSCNDELRRREEDLLTFEPA